jgi:hypothetical protein
MLEKKLHSVFLEVMVLLLLLLAGCSILERKIIVSYKKLVKCWALFLCVCQRQLVESLTEITGADREGEWEWNEFLC